MRARWCRTSGPLSPEEAARRERQRTSALSGIVEYFFSPDSRLILVPLGGDLYLYDTTAPATSAVRRLTRTEGYETDARFSPQGRYVSFVRDQNLYVIDLTDGREIAVTHGGGGTISYGMAEFIAQEEMDRDTGYWWSPDDTRLAYTRVDEAGGRRDRALRDQCARRRDRAPALPVRRGGERRRRAVRRPARRAGRPLRVDLGPSTDIYLARVDFFPDGRHLAVQRQSRDQKTLDLLKVRRDSGAVHDAADRAQRRPGCRCTTNSPSSNAAGSSSGRRAAAASSTCTSTANDGRLVRALTQGEHSDRRRHAAAGRSAASTNGAACSTSCRRATTRASGSCTALSLDRRGEPVQVTRGRRLAQR